MAIGTGNSPKLLWPGLNAIWGTSYEQYEKEYTKLFDIETSTKHYEEDVQINRFGLAPVIAEGAPVTYDTEVQGFVKRYSHTTIGLGFIVTANEIADNLYMEKAKPRIQSLAYSMRQSIEYRAANIYNNGFTSGTGGDGSFMCVTTHSSLAGNWSNLLNPAADFSQAALEDLLVQIAGATDSRGLIIGLKPVSLHIPRQLLFEVKRVLESDLQSNTAENATNVVKGTFPSGYFVNHFFTDSDAWFIRTDCPFGMRFFEREPIAFTDDGDFDTDNRKYKAKCRHSVGWTDPHGIYGSPGG